MRIMYTIASVIKGDRVVKLFISSSTVMKKAMIEKAPVAAAAWAENIVVTAASEQERMSSPKVSLLGGIQRPRQNQPHAVIKIHVAIVTVRACFLACETRSGSADQRRRRMSSLTTQVMIVSARSAPIRESGARSL